MQYFPIADPFSDLSVRTLDRHRCELSIFIDGQPRGLLRLYYHELAPVLDRFCGTKPIAALDLFEPLTQWYDDYKKNHVIAADGSLVHVGDLP
jgi:hypothetical protein